MNKKAPASRAFPEEWQRYAPEFDGYECAGSTEAAERVYPAARKRILAGEPISGTAEHLRTVPFAHPRRYRLMQANAEEKTRKQHVVDAILTTLHGAD